MKKFFYCLLIPSIIMMACSKNAKNVDASDADSLLTEETLAFDSCHWNDSVSFGGENVARVDFRCVYPTSGDQHLVDSICYWICEVYKDSAHRYYEDITGLLGAMGKRQLDNDSKELKGLLDEGAPSYVSYESDIDVSVLYEDSLYVTMNSTGYFYLGGAHGSTITNATTFRKSDGHRVGWELLGGIPRKALDSKIKTGLKEYFSVSTDADLMDCLLIGDPLDEAGKASFFKNHFPLPATPPFLTRDGVVILYQEYEIAPYAAGMPSCVIK